MVTYCEHSNVPAEYALKEERKKMALPVIRGFLAQFESLPIYSESFTTIVATVFLYNIVNKQTKIRTQTITDKTSPAITEVRYGNNTN